METWRHRHGGMDTWRNGENEDIETSNGKKENGSLGDFP
jgi:hypothetical protein